MARPRRDVPWLEWRDNAIAYACWYDAERRRTCRESLDTRDAGEAAKRFGRFLIDGPKAARPGVDVGLTVRRALDDYWTEHCEQTDDKGRPLVSDAVRQENIIRHLKAYFGDATLASIGPAESRAYAEARRSGLIGGGKRRKIKNGSDSTIRRELNCLVAAANHALKWKRLKADDMPRVELPAETEGEEVKWLTKDQISILLAETTGALHDFIALAYYTAARRRSIEALTKFQVDLPNSRLNLMRPGARATKKRKPLVPIYPEIRPIVERLMQADGEFLFGKNVDFYRAFAETVPMVLQVNEPMWPHMLRHSRATHLLMDGQDIYKVAKLLGDTVATVERVYGHSAPEWLATKKEATL